jgi:hypothetical protein
MVETYLLDMRSFCRVLGIGRTKGFELLKDPRIKSVTIGSKRLVVAESVRGYIASLQAIAEHAELGERR